MDEHEIITLKVHLADVLARLEAAKTGLWYPDGERLKDAAKIIHKALVKLDAPIDKPVKEK
jgi:hypothetical protein